jgi:muramoyltetrapeptide carboxypeptidase
LNVQKPARLKRNSKVAVISPSSNPDHVGIQIGLELLKKAGLKVILGDTTRKLLTRGGTAAEDRLRAKDFNWAFKDDSIDGVLCATGGYGSLRILDLLDYDMIRDHPKVFLGFSDITAFHLALTQLCNMITFHGPVVDIEVTKGAEDTQLGKQDLRTVIRQLMGQQEIVDIRNPPGGMMLMTINDGKASGRLCGGNLCLVTGTLGSRYEIDTKGKILMLEEIRETYYYLESHLTQLRLTRKLDQASGVIIGEISETLKPEGPTPSVEEIVRERVGGTGRPSIWGLCCGHGKRNMLLPLNAKVSLDASERRIKVVESVLD